MAGAGGRRERKSKLEEEGGLSSHCRVANSKQLVRRPSGLVRPTKLLPGRARQGGRPVRKSDGLGDPTLRRRGAVGLGPDKAATAKAEKRPWSSRSGGMFHLIGIHLRGREVDWTYGAYRNPWKIEIARSPISGNLGWGRRPNQSGRAENERTWEPTNRC